MPIPNRPKRITITQRISSVTNAFVNSVVPNIEPSAEEMAQAISILGMSEDDVRCAYCGDRATEWDHLMPLIDDKKPTGYITDIYNLIPACGKCNQSKGSKPWLMWIRGPAKLSPRSRGIAELELENRIGRILKYEEWAKEKRRTLDIAAIAGVLWDEHERDRLDIAEKMRAAEERAIKIRTLLRAHFDGHTP